MIRGRLYTKALKNLLSEDFDNTQNCSVWWSPISYLNRGIDTTMVVAVYSVRLLLRGESFVELLKTYYFTTLNLANSG